MINSPGDLVIFDGVAITFTSFSGQMDRDGYGYSRPTGTVTLPIISM
ncbi:hypothetical protein [Sporomusa carbonis]